MKIDDSLITQWEPKIQKLLKDTFVVNMDREDIAQELRIAIIKAAQGFDEDRGVIFHTYLHRAMINTIRTLIARGKRHPNDLSLDSTSVIMDKDYDKLTLADTLEDEDSTFEEFEFKDLLKNSLNI